MAEIDPHVGDRAAAMPGKEFGDRAPRPCAVDRAVERLELRRVLRALRRGDGRRRQAVDAADALGDPPRMASSQARGSPLAPIAAPPSAP